MWDLVRLTIEDLAETSLEDIPVESKFLLKINFGDHINCRVWTFNIPFMFDEDRECGVGGLLRLVRYPSKLSLFFEGGRWVGSYLDRCLHFGGFDSSFCINAAFEVGDWCECAQGV